MTFTNLCKMIDMEDESQTKIAEAEQLKKENGERIADREKHETALMGIIDELRHGGYFRTDEKTHLTFPKSENLGSPWRKRDGSWREGMGKAVACCETTALLKQPTDPQRDARYPTGDHLEKALKAAVYLVEIWPDYENASSDAFKVDYYIYEVAS